MTASLTYVKPNKIIILGDPVYKELALKALDVYGNGKVTPGMLVERAANKTVQPHSTSGGNAQPIFALESPFRLGADIDTVYDKDGENVRIGFCRPGDEVYALLAVGQNVAENALLQSNGAGSLMAYSATTPPLQRLVCRALEAVNNSAGSAPARIKVEVV